MLELTDVDICADGQTICRNINLRIKPGERHILLGPNGSGKSSLLNAIMGVRPFTVCGGQATFNGQDLAEMSIDARAQAGIGIAYQRPPALEGVQVSKLVHAMEADESYEVLVKELGLEHLDARDVNCGFSGGESKRFEVLKLALQHPQLFLFDEPESGVDMEQVGVVGAAISKVLDDPERSALIITHTGFILDSINADVAHLMIDGTIHTSADPAELLEDIRVNGYPKGQLV